MCAKVDLSVLRGIMSDRYGHILLGGYQDSLAWDAHQVAGIYGHQKMTSAQVTQGGDG